MKTAHPLEEIFHPQSVAIAGASTNQTTWGFNYTRHLLEYGFRGQIYPVNPRHPEILGLKVYPSLREIPGTVDYVVSSVPAAEVLTMLEDCARKKVKAVQLFTARFSETGRPEAVALEQKILKRARQLGIRLIGPNCMGLYNPRHGMSFADELPREAGTVGLASQSGGGAAEICRMATLRGVRFSKAITYGNAIDFNECDYLDYFAQDPETKIILMYIEGVKEGRRFFDTLRQATATKPVIIAKGGRGESGTRAVTSHTASLAGSRNVWEAAITQAGAISVADFYELVDMAVSFYFLPPIRGARVGVVGGGGGSGVLAADQCEEAGLEVIPLPAEIRRELKRQGNPVWDWLGNPVDMSIAMGNTEFAAGDMLKMMARHPDFDLFIVSMWLPYRRGQPEISARTYVAQYQQTEDNLKPVLAVVAESGLGADDYDSKAWQLTCQVRTELTAARIPFYPSIGRAARAARQLIDYYRRVSNPGLQ